MTKHELSLALIATSFMYRQVRLILPVQSLTNSEWLSEGFPTENHLKKKKKGMLKEKLKSLLARILHSTQE